MKILVLAPHTDDGELGAGGSLARFIRTGHDVYYVAFSTADKSVPPEFSPHVLSEEVTAATAVLGIPSTNVRISNFEVRDFPAKRQAILEVMVGLQRELDPDMVLLPNTNDSHQDHQTIASEGFRAFKHSTILGYELPSNSTAFASDAFVVLTSDDLDYKLAALSEYKSQAHRPAIAPQFIEALARVRGCQVGAEFAEAFEVVRWVMR